MKPTRLLSPKQVAEETGWPEGTVRALVKAKAIAVIRLNDTQKKPRIWIAREDLEAFIQRQRRPAKTEPAGKARTLTLPGAELFT